ncbi:MAG: VacJ family lipoprotein [Gammaproteobacteria bacterium]|nr:VacJ family lipoprotein [Gammaproteobacteria bacterium]
MAASRNIGAIKKLTLALVVFGAAGLLSACASAPAVDSTETPDPYEDWNRKFYAFNDALDKAILAPVAHAYIEITPAPMRTGVHNFFDNLSYPGVFINDFLQGKIEQGFEDIGRFIFNSTFGLGGLIDFAGGLGFSRNEEDFGQTLAVWGMESGFYLDLPFFGPNTARDTTSIPAGMVTDVLFYVESAITFPLGLLRIVDKRASLDSAIKVRDKTALDPYVFQREAYVQKRRFLIHDGNPPPDDLQGLEPIR